MFAEVEQADGTYITEERTPICQHDFCDRCGDCLVCDAGTCWAGGVDNGDHRWVIYFDETKVIEYKKDLDVT